MHSDWARRMRCWRLPSAAALLMWASFGSASPNAAGAASFIRIDNPWIRWLPAGVPAAGYVTLVNAGDGSVTLIAAGSANFASVSIHRSVARGGSIRMEEVKEIAIGPHSRLDFGAQGYHLMLMNPLRSIESEKQIPITLHFSDGTSLTIPFELRKPAADALSDARSLVEYAILPGSTGVPPSCRQSRRSFS